MKGLGALVNELIEANLQIWHWEDRARANDYADAKEAKRQIDQWNQKRNDLIEAIDETMTESGVPYLTVTSGGAG